MNNTYLTTEELSKKIKYDCGTICNKLKDSVLIEGKHYLYPFGGRKILYIWEAIEKDMFVIPENDLALSFENGGIFNASC